MTHDAELLRADLRARADALDVGRSFIVQAPAGSGKTELLIQRYLKLLAVVDEPEEIIAITFTRKAAAEMKIRVLQALQRARRGIAPESPHQRLTTDAANGALRRDEERGWQLVDNPRRMRIQTLDALNAWIARMQPLSAGSGTGNPVAGDAESKSLYRTAAAATLDWLGEAGPVRDAVRDVLRHLDNNTGAYIGYLARMLETRDQWLPFIGSGGLAHDDDGMLRARLERNLDRIVRQHLDRLHEAFPAELVPELLPLAAYAAENISAVDSTQNPIIALIEMRSLPATDAPALEEWCGVAELLLTGTGTWRKRLNRNQGFPPGDDGQKDRIHSLLDSLMEHDRLRQLLHGARGMPPIRYEDEQWSVLLALFRLLPMAVAELRREFGTNRVTDYIEVALAADTALGTADDPGAIALLLDYQVRHVLVDEMQDTSRAQYRMIEALTGGWEAGDGRTLFCVGDPMQSIYRFRNAEVAQFLLAQQNGIGTLELEQLVLRQNFRSGTFLVHWFNTVFPMVLPSDDDPARGAVSYADAFPGLESEGECTIYPLFTADTDAEAGRACGIVARVLAENPDDDLAILVRSRAQLAALLPKLRGAGIAYRSVEIDRLTDLPEIIDVLALTRAMVHPGDRLAWLALLRSPWIGWGWQDLHALAGNDTRSTVWDLLNDPDRTGRLSADARESLANAWQVLESLHDVSRSDALRDRVEKAWLSLGGPGVADDRSVIENVYRFLDVLETLEVGGSLHDVAELEAQLDLEKVSSNVSASLQVMTMHRAKGLQFDHVLLPGLGRITRPPEQSVLSWFDLPDAHGNEEKIISPVGPRADLDRDPIHRFIERTESEKQRHESGRLLYVACTRARKSLHLLGHTGVSGDGESCKPPDSRSLLKLLWPAVGGHFEEAFEPAEPAASADSETWLLPCRRRLDPPWQLPDSPPPPGARAPAKADRATVEFDWVGSEARIAGTIVHRWLQLAAEGRADLGDSAGLRATSERWLREAGLQEQVIEATLERIGLALDNVAGDSRGQWLIGGTGHAELSLTGTLDGAVESVVIDRVLVDEDGTHWIVDYKTSTHEGGDLRGFLEAEARRYDDQLRRYAALYRAWSGQDVRCALYFPLLGEFLEIPT